jgi:hypothetical protein
MAKFRLILMISLVLLAGPYGDILAINNLGLFDLNTGQLLTPSYARVDPPFQTELARDIAFSPEFRPHHILCPSFYS